MNTKSKTDKRSNVIHRTTSESLRLSDAESLRPVTSTPQPGSMSSRKSKQTPQSSSSFQITAVSMTRSEGDDSADDLDESHTDDISRVTDNETPSYSEDSKDIDENLPAASFSTVPLVNPNDKEIINTQQPEDRFKVVKIETKKPFHRGRWTCFDFLDSSNEDGKSDSNVTSLLQPIRYPFPPGNLQYNSSFHNFCNSYSHKKDWPDIYAPVDFSSINQSFSYNYFRNNEALNASFKYPIPNTVSSHSNLMSGDRAQVSEDVSSTSSTNMEDVEMKEAGSKMCSSHSVVSLCTTRRVFSPVKRQTSASSDNSVNAAFNRLTELISCLEKESNGNTDGVTGSSVAIDNKIAQAMDLVKNHLMFTVREEVEVLKVKISELLDRISQLETENNFLRANATPDVLNALEKNLNAVNTKQENAIETTMN